MKAESKKKGKLIMLKERIKKFNEILVKYEFVASDSNTCDKCCFKYSDCDYMKFFTISFLNFDCGCKGHFKKVKNKRWIKLDKIAGQLKSNTKIKVVEKIDKTSTDNETNLKIIEGRIIIFTKEHIIIKVKINNSYSNYKEHVFKKSDLILKYETYFLVE